MIAFKVFWKVVSLANFFHLKCDAKTSLTPAIWNMPIWRDSMSNHSSFVWRFDKKQQILNCRILNGIKCFKLRNNITCLTCHFQSAGDFSMSILTNWWNLILSGDIQKVFIFSCVNTTHIQCDYIDFFDCNEKSKLCRCSKDVDNGIGGPNQTMVLTILILQGYHGCFKYTSVKLSVPDIISPLLRAKKFLSLEFEIDE